MSKKYIENKEYDKAKNILLSSLNNNCKEKEVYLYLAQVYDEGYKDYGKAIKYYKMTLKCNLTEEEKIKVNYIIGELYTLRTDYLDFQEDMKEIKKLEKIAIEYFKKALNKKYKQYFIKSAIHLSICYYTIEEYEEVILTLKKLYKLELNKYQKREIFMRYGLAYFELGDFKAIKYFKKINTSIIDENLISAKLFLGRLYYYKNRISKALEEEIKIFKYKKENPDLVPDKKLDIAYSIIQEFLEKIFPKNIQLEFLKTIENYEDDIISYHEVYKKLSRCFFHYDLKEVIVSYLIYIRLLMKKKIFKKD